ncbi:MAG: hypothetical protein EBU31_07110, partial [Proteobacteria bacterium]|nr:hypothetical protein [Pseudomonadota bacterium]
LVGIYESMRVRREIEKMDFSKPQAPKDNWLSKAYATAMKRAQAAQQGGKQAPSKKFRDR